MAEKTFDSLLCDFLASCEKYGIAKPTVICLPSKNEAISLIRRTASEWPSISHFNCGGVIKSIQDDKLHGFILFGVEFRWPLNKPSKVQLS